MCVLQHQTVISTCRRHPAPAQQLLVVSVPILQSWRYKLLCMWSQTATSEIVPLIIFMRYTISTAGINGCCCVHPKCRESIVMDDGEIGGARMHKLTLYQVSNRYPVYGNMNERAVLVVPNTSFGNDRTGAGGMYSHSYDYCCT